ncbi:MGT family glycosyltransferase [Actinoalloteichus hoggarensis]|uniref:Oleandomycin glycosyltransferase n=1 Tax=Actinoalloteichus hoggarensis TaxID=1470176 RepID=A0A221W476_9PSEU|nr:macrolide family glycosyltransferase [Actinoalloteichus hoggarensis]ASO20645.1 Oleandomycin glycosyltransferase [Actinoalloteichus hoggarensis]MBB5923686.1 MGT family glycosyltransferase [Actinoalloteichus hoggarensis]
MPPSSSTPDISDAAPGKGLRILMMPLPIHGHVMPTLPLVTELVRRGHQVVYAATQTLAETVGATGAEVLIYESPSSTNPPGDLFDTEHMSGQPIRAVREAQATTASIEAYFADGPPDVVVYDLVTFFSGRVLSRKWNRPGLELFPTFASSHEFVFLIKLFEQVGARLDPRHPSMAEYFTELMTYLGGHGIDDPALMNDPAEDANLAFFPKMFQLGSESFDDRHAFVGPCLERAEPETSWTPPADGRPVVLVSLGTTTNEQPDFFRMCARAFEGLPWHVVLTLGSRVRPEELGEIPANVEVHQWLSHLAVLPHAKAVVTQAGMGSLMQALHFGVTPVMVPHSPEQQMIAERAADLGVGPLIRHDRIDAALLRAAVREADAPNYRAAVATLRESIREAGGVDRAVEVVESRARATTPA